MNLKNQIPGNVRLLASVLGRDNVRIAGGAVRDLLLGIQPKDFDLATPLLPVDVMDLLRGAGFTVLETGLQHGTVTAMVNSEPVEITTLRVDETTDGRHAEISFTEDWELDAERRDLTINAMFLDMDGNVHDFFGGRDDLDNNHIRFVGDASERIQEDFLRILRFFRFCGRMGRGGDDMTLQVISENVAGLSQISGERIWMEMQKILTGQVLLMVLSDMQEAGVLEAIGLSTSDRGLRLAGVANMSNCQPVTVLAGLVNGDLSLAQKLKDRWKLSNTEFQALEALTLMLRQKGHKLDELDLGWFQRQIVKDGVNRRHVEEFACFTGKIGMVEEELRPWIAPVFPVRGHDLLELGMTPGPDVGKKLRELRAAWERSGCKADRESLLKRF